MFVTTWKIWILFTAMRATLSANIFHFVLSATSPGELLPASYRVFFAVKWLGGAYLIYLGIRALAGKTDIVVIPAKGTNKISDRRIFRNGFALQAANPKALIFFTALLPQFVNPERPIGSQIGLLTVSATVVEFVILAGYGILADKASRFARTPRFATATNRLSAAMLIGAGTGLAAVHRD